MINKKVTVVHNPFLDFNDISTKIGELTRNAHQLKFGTRQEKISAMNNFINAASLCVDLISGNDFISSDPVNKKIVALNQILQALDSLKEAKKIACKLSIATTLRDIDNFYIPALLNLRSQMDDSF